MSVIEPQSAVQSIKKQCLVEVRIMANPPPLNKTVRERVGILLGESLPIDWKGIRAFTMKENFMLSIVHFNTDVLTDPGAQDPGGCRLHQEGRGEQD